MNVLKIKPIKHNFNKFFEINIPSSKSLSIRAIILASISHGNSKIYNVLKCTDVDDCLLALKNLGINIKNENDYLEIEGCNGIFPIAQNEIYFGSSGITSRFLLAIICASLFKNNNYKEIILDGSEQLRKRTIKPLVDSLISIGANISYIKDDGCFPLLLKSSKFNNSCEVSVSGLLSSQYVSAILMMATLLENKIIINIKDVNSLEHPYIKMAIQTIKDFGINNILEISENKYSFFSENYKATTFIVETDLNTASYFLGLISIIGGTIKIKNINKNSLQPGILFINVLQKMGCDIKFDNNNIMLTAPKKLSGGFNIDMFYMAEMTTLLAVLASFADKLIEIHGVKHIRNHESDRLHAISIELKKAKIDIEEFDDGLKIYPNKAQFFEANTYEDHRIAMSLSILGAGANGVNIIDFNCVSKTCPEFFKILNELY